jgi:hypothetical protein
MTSKTIWFKVVFCSLLLLMAVMGANSVYALSSAASQAGQHIASSASTGESTVDVRGTWSGTFSSKHPEVVPFKMTVVITPDSNGDLVGRSTLSSRCLKHAQLKVMVDGFKIVLAGSDEQGDNITVRGTVDQTGTILNSTYILDGSATGRCETDDGTGTLTKQ